MIWPPGSWSIDANGVANLALGGYTLAATYQGISASFLASIGCRIRRPAYAVAVDITDALTVADSTAGSYADADAKLAGGR
jgi:hypothetical protein